MAVVRAGAAESSLGGTISEFDILKSSHKFLREDDNVDDSQLSWDERLAKKYYSSLYREYAVCNLKHYKSGNFALRWRTEEEVLSGAGETTCGNTRCPLHKEFPEENSDIRPPLTTLELPFSYVEHGESKFALVKVVRSADGDEVGDVARQKRRLSEDEREDEREDDKERDHKRRHNSNRLERNQEREHRHKRTRDHSHSPRRRRGSSHDGRCTP
ncbi:folate-sensitive fragile site protein Fra10Ac1-domain-containing protein [Trametes punicea]|nr:folate-sensitive fragile site protein Fra10Ac1-domain-containing protein [Trametes punicea]